MRKHGSAVFSSILDETLCLDWGRAAKAGPWVCGRLSTSGLGWRVAPKEAMRTIWLILPVVIRSSQRLSHACVSINLLLWNCERLIISVIVYLIISYYLDNRSNSRANTCVNTRLLEGWYLLDWNQLASAVFWWFIITLRIAWLLPAMDHSSFCPISLDGSVLDYHGFNGWRGIRVWFRRGSLRDGYHIQGRQQARKLPNPDTGR